VGAVDELVQLIMVSRLYEANTKAAHAYDERMKTLLGVAAG
jgi:flagellar basal body rod protein FlgG